MQKLLLTIVLATTLAAQSSYDKLLSVADVEKLTGATGVKTVPTGSRPGAGGHLNFVRGDGKLLLMVNFGDAQLYTKARTQKEIKVGDQTYPMELFAHAVTGVGDEAFASPPGPVQSVLYARKGNHAVSVSTYYPATGEKEKPLLTEAQLRQIAQLVLSRE